MRLSELLKPIGTEKAEFLLDYIASRLNSIHTEMERCDATQLPNLQGRIAELRLLQANAEYVRNPRKFEEQK